MMSLIHIYFGAGVLTFMKAADDEKYFALFSSGWVSAALGLTISSP